MTAWYDGAGRGECAESEGGAERRPARRCRIFWGRRGVSIRPGEDDPLVAHLGVWYSFEFPVGPRKTVFSQGAGRGAVAQLVRVPDCRSGGCGFESRPRRLEEVQGS